MTNKVFEQTPDQSIHAEQDGAYSEFYYMHNC